MAQLNGAIQQAPKSFYSSCWLPEKPQTFAAWPGISACWASAGACHTKFVVKDGATQRCSVSEVWFPHATAVILTSCIVSLLNIIEQNKRTGLQLKQRGDKCWMFPTKPQPSKLHRASSLLDLLLGPARLDLASIKTWETCFLEFMAIDGATQSPQRCMKGVVSQCNCSNSHIMYCIQIVSLLNNIEQEYTRTNYSNRKNEQDGPIKRRQVLNVSNKTTTFEASSGILASWSSPGACKTWLG